MTIVFPEKLELSSFLGGESLKPSVINSFTSSIFSVFLK